MRKPYAPAPPIISMGVPVAIATDCNPGSSFTESMPFVFGLAVLQMGLTVFEALTASTLNAAYALGLGHETGSLTPGKAGRLSSLGKGNARNPGVSRRVISGCQVYRAGMRAWKEQT